MSTGAMVFMAVSWGSVLGLAVWAFARVMAAQRRRGDEPAPDAPRDPTDR